MNKLDKNITAIPQWDKSAKQIWNERFEALTSEAAPKAVEVPDESATVVKTLVQKGESAHTISMWHRMKYIVSAAAVALIVISTTAFLYTKDISAQLGQTRIAQLPDGSSVELSAGATVSYRPLLWWLSPDVKMSGEAYFIGKHTEGFSVKTTQGDITVLGTSFDVRTYNDRLAVACIEGKVKVANEKSSVVLTANMQTTAEKGRLTTGRITDVESVIGWTRGVFSFNNEPLREVINDVERYYGVKIEMPQNIDTLRYTGRFTRKKSSTEVLRIICQTYGITLKITR